MPEPIYPDSVIDSDGTVIELTNPEEKNKRTPWKSSKYQGLAGLVESITGRLLTASASACAGYYTVKGLNPTNSFIIAGGALPLRVALHTYANFAKTHLNIVIDKANKYFAGTETFPEELDEKISKARFAGKDASEILYEVVLPYTTVTRKEINTAITKTAAQKTKKIIKGSSIWFAIGAAAGYIV